MVALPDRTRRNDERVRHVQCAGDELFAAAAGDGSGWDVAKAVREDERQDKCALGGNSDVRHLLGLVSGTRFQKAGYAGHHVVRGQLDAGIRYPGGVADSRAGIEARVQSAWRLGGRDYGWRLSVRFIVPGVGGERARDDFGNEWVGLRSDDHAGWLRRILGYEKTPRLGD